MIFCHRNMWSFSDLAYNLYSILQLRLTISISKLCQYKPLFACISMYDLRHQCCIEALLHNINVITLSALVALVFPTWLIHPGKDRKISCNNASDMWLFCLLLYPVVHTPRFSQVSLPLLSGFVFFLNFLVLSHRIVSFSKEDKSANLCWNAKGAPANGSG